jgi:hypothetical protein
MYLNKLKCFIEMLVYLVTSCYYFYSDFITVSIKIIYIRVHSPSFLASSLVWTRKYRYLYSAWRHLVISTEFALTICRVKGTVSRDFRPSVFSSKHPSWAPQKYKFEFAKIFQFFKMHDACGAIDIACTVHAVSLTPHACVHAVSLIPHAW